MKAIVCTRYGSADALQCKEVAKPVPRDDEILIRIHATTVTSGDWRVRSLTVPLGFKFLMRLALGFTGPRQAILGSELSGTIESVGQSVTRFKVGDAVFAFSGARMGCHAQYKCMRETGAVALKPCVLTFGEAAALSFGGTTALDFLRRARLQRGERVLVNGASGSVGTAAVQLARHFGATVTGVCSAANAPLVQSLGATRVIDYTSEDFAKSGAIYDVIVDTVGTAPYPRCRNALSKRGRLLLVLASLPAMLPSVWAPLISARKIIAGPAAERADDLHLLAQLAETGAFKPVIDRRYAFEQIAEAHRYVATGHKRGNVVVMLEPDALV